MIFHQLNFVADGFEIFNKFIIVKKVCNTAQN